MSGWPGLTLMGSRLAQHKAGIAAAQYAKKRQHRIALYARRAIWRAFAGRGVRLAAHTDPGVATNWVNNYVEASRWAFDVAVLERRHHCLSAALTPRPGAGWGTQSLATHGGVRLRGTPVDLGNSPPDAYVICRG